MRLIAAAIAAASGQFNDSSPLTYSKVNRASSAHSLSCISPPPPCRSLGNDNFAQTYLGPVEAWRSPVVLCNTKFRFTVPKNTQQRVQLLDPQQLSPVVESVSGASANSNLNRETLIFPTQVSRVQKFHHPNQFDNSKIKHKRSQADCLL
jgi:hypothetical protein